MDIKLLLALMKDPAVVSRLYAQILGAWTGAASLGVTKDHDDRPALLVRVEGEPSGRIPRSIVLEGEVVPVVVRGHWRVPEPLGHKSQAR